MTISTQQTYSIPPPTISFPPHFSSQNKETMFDPRIKFSNTYDHQNGSYGDRGMTNFVSKDRKLTQNYERHSNLYREQGLQFGPQFHPEAMDSDDSGVCSPPLWKNNPGSPKSPSQPLLSHHNHRSLSPNSRTQAIVRGQWELMEMVKNMPESSYELTLKDLVENPKTESQDSPLVEIRSPHENQSLHQREAVKVKRQESKKSDKNMIRSGSFENNGLFLKVVVPFAFKSKKKKNFASNTSGKVSPKPEVVKGGGEKDWWKKRFTGSSDSDSSRTSNSGGSSGSTVSSGGSSSDRSNSNGRKRNGLLTGCWPCFNRRNKKSVE